MTLREELFKNQDLKYKEFHSKLIPTVNTDEIIGVRIPVLRKIGKRMAKENQDFPIEYYEEKMIKGFIVGYKKYDDIADFLAALSDFVPLIDNWAICDCVCSTLKLTSKNRQAVWNFLMQYKNADEYAVRFMVVMLMDYYLIDDCIDAVIDILKSIDREEYYINMAIAWALSVAFVKYESKVMPLLENRVLSEWIHNKTIQKIRDSYRVSRETKAYLKSLKIK